MAYLHNLMVTFTGIVIQSRCISNESLSILYINYIFIMYQFLDIMRLRCPYRLLLYNDKQSQEVRSNYDHIIISEAISNILNGVCLQDSYIQVHFYTLKTRNVGLPPHVYGHYLKSQIMPMMIISLSNLLQENIMSLRVESHERQAQQAVGIVF